MNRFSPHSPETSAANESYRVLCAPCSAEIREKGSRFLALIEPVADSGNARALRERFAADYRDASHHCWAERIGWPAVERASDAGEPRGTAGEPIARALRARDLSDVCAVVVRWFGGVKLGKGGLARAYAAATAAALEAGRFEWRSPMTSLRLRMPYDKVGAVQHLTRGHAGEWSKERFGVDVEATVRLPLAEENAVRAALADLRVEVVTSPEDDS